MRRWRRVMGLLVVRPAVCRTTLLGLLMLVGALSACAGRAPRPQGPAPQPPPGGRGPSAPSLPAAPGRGAPEPVEGLSLRLELGARGSGTVVRVDLETYVRDVVVGEIAVAAPDGPLARPVYEAQAIVARTYALAVRGRHAADGFDLCSTTHCQVYQPDQWRRSRWAAEVDAAVRRTRGRFLASAGRPIEAVFHAHCGGHTSAAAEVWRSVGAPYLQGVDDPFCLREQAAPWTATLPLDTLRTALNRRPRTEVGDRLDGVQVLRRDAGGRVVEVAVSGTRAPVVTGEDFRLAVLAAAGPRSLRSARFDVQRVGADLVFTGRGSGHGVGLCQTGLIGRLRAGQSAEQALAAYYPGAILTSVGGT
ncbi:SpoIID/LytB domain-containing protein [Luteitalea sp.]|uniref:SpoIID/LytB domain-containing protein n=1 Tax=Luteitalea sp. TaxID=2004800 RepID=UPI0025C55155|nr:SpoIID/LytB domain-containing protein [Luteitalea sp.]